MWQDIVISICLLSFSYALIPQIIQNSKLKKCGINIQTALINAVGLYILAICFITLELYFSVAMELISGTLWGVILIQRLMYK